MIFWYDDTEGSKDRAYQSAEEFYNASGINGGANIRIPVVYRNNSNLFLDPDVDYNEVFSCPSTSASEEEELTSSSPSITGIFSSLSTSLSIALFFAFVVFEFAI